MAGAAERHYRTILEGEDPMGYHIDDAAMSLGLMAERLESTDLIPSHLPLLEGLQDKVAALGAAGIGSVAELRRGLKRPADLSTLAGKSGIDADYLALLRRAVEGWFPKPPRLSEFPGADPLAIEALEATGIRDARALLESGPASRRDAASSAGIEMEKIDELFALADLSRLQWVSPLFARLLYDAGYTSAAGLASSDGNAVYDAVMAYNAGRYRGTIGRRDMARLVLIARSVVG